MYKTRLHIFPLLQAACFISALILLDSNLLLSLLFLFASALFLNFSLHITIHHFVHFRLKAKTINTILEFVYTILLALPYSFYRMQHYNHHRYDNRIGDMTSTWEKKNDEITPKSFFNYSFFWFLNGSLKTALAIASRDGDINNKEKRKIRHQIFAILSVYGLLMWLNLWYGLAYLSLFYVGWSFISITNYGQHLPIKYDSTDAYSYPNKLYNGVFFNNGLHLEHHLEPHLDYPELKSKNDSKITWPHLLIAFFRKK